MLIRKAISTFFISGWISSSFTVAHCTMILFHFKNVLLQKIYTLIVKLGHIVSNLEIWEYYPDWVSLEISFRSLTLISLEMPIYSILEFMLLHP